MKYSMSGFRKQDDSHPNFTFHCKLSKITLDFISELIYLNCTINTPFKVKRKAEAILYGGFISQISDSIHLKVLSTLLGMFLRYIPYCRSKTFHKGGYDKMNEPSYFKRSLVSCINKLRDTAVELGTKDTFHLELLPKQ